MSIEETRRFVTALYRGILKREPDPSGFAAAVKSIEAGTSYEDAIRGMLSSKEFSSARGGPSIAVSVLPDLTKLFPGHYEPRSRGDPIFNAASDEDFNLLENLIEQHHYYDSLGVWSPQIDLDKMIVAATVRGLGGRSVFELGCFTGPILSLLEREGAEVAGLEISHLAFVMAYPNVRSRIAYGDLLDMPVRKQYGVVLAMDVLEHLNPLKLPNYLLKLKQLVSQDGYVYINSPMFGPDEIFGNPFPKYLPEWNEVGDARFWRKLHCDKKGWPMHGHLVWAGPGWWERQFLSCGLVRDKAVEAGIHGLLAGWFETAYARRSLFVLKSADNQRKASEVLARIGSELDRVPGFLTVK